MSDKPKKFRLDIVNAAEDVPRLIRAYGRACDGEFALVLRPPEQRGTLVLVAKDGAMMWRSGTPDGRERASAAVERGDDRKLRLRVLDGAYAGSTFFPYDAAGLSRRIGDSVPVAFVPDDQFAHVVDAVGADAPRRPDSACMPKEAVALVKVEQKAVPKPGPVTLKGQWAGHLYCDAGEPRVALSRKLASYGTLHVESDAVGGAWNWRVERAEKWFSTAGAEQGTAGTLVGAIERGLAQAMRLLGEACSVRDSRRRAAMDTTWAETHPIRPAREGRDPTERLKEPTPRRGRAASPKALDEPLPAPDVPQTPEVLDRVSREVAAEANALASLDATPWVWEEPLSKERIVAWFHERDLSDIAEAIAGYEPAPDHPIDAFLDGLAGRLAVDAVTEQQARAQLATLGRSWTAAPALLERARKLILYARRMAGSGLCRGKDQRDAVEAIQRAVQAYEEARTAIASGEPIDGVRTLRRIGERIGLAAAKASRSCATGNERRREPSPPSSEPKRRRGRGAPRPAAPTPSAGPGKAPEVDDAKDQALIAAFAAAMDAAMKDAT